MKHLFEIFLENPMKKRVLQASLSFIAVVTLSLAYADHDEDTKAKVGKEESESHEAHDEKVVALNAAQLKTAAIATAQASPASIRETLPLYGTIETNGDHTQHISARYPGIIRTVNKKLGDKVQAGDVLATVEGNESLRSYTLTAAYTGVVAERNANAGDHTGDKPVFVITDLSSVWVDVAVFPRDFSKVHTGQSVRIVNPNDEQAADGTIVAIGAISNTNQTLSARVLLDNSQGIWVPGLFVNAEVTLATTQVKLAIRNEALQDYEGKQVVFVQGKAGFEPRPITLGRTDGIVSEVLSGINAGETYVTTNSFIIKADLGKDGAEHE